MRNFTRTIYSAIALAVSSLYANSANAQCTITSPLGQSATVTIQPISIVVTSPCPAAGYNYNVNFNYSVVLASGTIVDYITGSFQCGASNNHAFGLTGAAGTGNKNTGTNPYRTVSDCGTATPASLGCSSLTLGVQFRNEGTIFRNCFLTAPTPLPVKVLSFDAGIEGGKVAIKWTTVAESAGTSFILERSNNAKDWAAITSKDGKGAAHVNNTYSYTDEMPQSGMNYYRLQQVEAGGVATYTRVLGVEAKNKGNVIGIYPNPNNGNMVHFTGLETAADWSVKVLNTTSATVYQSASVTTDLFLPNLAPGIYFIQLQHSKTGNTEILKMIKN